MDEPPPRDYSHTLFLPKTGFKMRAGLPKSEPAILAQWDKADLYGQLRRAARGRRKFILHDGPPYANGHIHIGTALNKVLKDIINRSMQMSGWDANYVPGWDCHGLPIEWKVEEAFRARGQDKDSVPGAQFRAECRSFAQGWIDCQRTEFRRLGVIGDWRTPYLTMDHGAEAIIAAELMKFAASGQLYRGAKPVMWSIAEQTALAEAEVEYHDFRSDQIWVRFPVIKSGAGSDLAAQTSIAIWTTTPWTLPANRAIAYGPKIEYGLYEMTNPAPDMRCMMGKGECLILADRLAREVFQAMGDADGGTVMMLRRRTVSQDELAAMICAHPFAGRHGGAYDFSVPLLAGAHVSDDAGTGFVHTAPGHGVDDYVIWQANMARLRAAGLETDIAEMVDAHGVYTPCVHGFEGKSVLSADGRPGSANGAVIGALDEAGAILAASRLVHQYPHSWRSKKPLIYRSTPQWFIALDRPLGEDSGDTLRARALAQIDATRFVPEAGRARLRSMIAGRPDWLVSRQRAWGVPLAIFVHRMTGEILVDKAVNAAIVAAFEKEGADAWFAPGARERFLGAQYAADEFEKIDDILDVWFDSGSTHAICLERRDDLKPEAPHDFVLYLEGSDQHRGWFHSSLLESCATRAKAPYNGVVTHGFTMAADGRKMSKSLGNQTNPQDIIDRYGADILRLWVASSDYVEDQRIGEAILRTNVDAYRKIRNTLRWMLGALSHFDGDPVPLAEMPALERFMLHRLGGISATMRTAYDAFDIKKAFFTLSNFMTLELSAFYFDIRKDALYCEGPSSPLRRAALTVIEHLFRAVTLAMAPILSFTCEEAWAARYGSAAGSVHLEDFADIPAAWRDDALARQWEQIRSVRRVVTGALEIERREKRIGSSLEAHPVIYIQDRDMHAAARDVPMADICIVSDVTMRPASPPGNAFCLDDVGGVGVVIEPARGRKCARCWKFYPDIGQDAEFPDLSARCAAVMREFGRESGPSS